MYLTKIMEILHRTINAAKELLDHQPMKFTPKRLLGAGVSLLLATTTISGISILTYESETITYAKRILETPGLVKETKRSFVEEMRLDGYSIHWIPLLGAPQRRRIASAGKDGSFLRQVPSSMDDKFPPQAALEWGDCFAWEGPEVINVNEAGNLVEVYAASPRGFIRLNKTIDEKTDWFVLFDDPRCKMFPDSSSVK